MKKVLLLLATEKGYSVLNNLIAKGWKDNIGGVISFREIGVQKDYFDDIKNLSLKNDIHFYNWKEEKNNLEHIIEINKITSCIVISWRYLLPISLNEVLEDPFIVLHDSLLPKYRGFAPIVTAMLYGEKEVGATVLFATENVDQGDIIMQGSFKIDDNMYIKDIISKMSELYSELCINLMEKLVTNSIESHPQDENEVTYSIWRDEEDYVIDWTQPAEKIDCLIRAVSFPYKGAKTMCNGSEIRILKSELVDDIPFAIRTPGKLWKIEDGKPLVVCGSGMLKIDLALDEDGNPYVFKKLRTRLLNN